MELKSEFLDELFSSLTPVRLDLRPNKPGITLEALPEDPDGPDPINIFKFIKKYFNLLT